MSAVLLLAGVDTTTRAVSTVLYQLALNPSTQDRICEEMLVCGRTSLLARSRTQMPLCIAPPCSPALLGHTEARQQAILISHTLSSQPCAGPPSVRCHSSQGIPALLRTHAHARTHTRTHVHTYTVYAHAPTPITQPQSVLGPVQADTSDAPMTTPQWKQLGYLRRAVQECLRLHQIFPINVRKFLDRDIVVCCMVRARTCTFGCPIMHV